METELDLFGEKIEKNNGLRESFIEPPFSVLDTKSANWKSRKNKWKSLGIKSEIGRELHGHKAAFRTSYFNYGRISPQDISIFDPALCELMYSWFCPMGGV